MRISDWSSDVCSSDLLALTGAEREEVELLAIDVEQPREEEAARGARDEQVAVERARPVALDAAAPDFIARAIIADRRGDANRDHIVPRARGQRLFDTRRCGRAVGGENGGGSGWERGGQDG